VDEGKNAVRELQGWAFKMNVIPAFSSYVWI